MEVEFIDHIIKVTLMCACLLLAACVLWFETFFGLSLFLGACWACCNLFFLKHLAVKLLHPDKRDPLQGFFLIGVKFPLLYLAGYGLLTITALSTEGILVGFSLLFGVVLMKSLYLGMMGFMKRTEGSKTI